MSNPLLVFGGSKGGVDALAIIFTLLPRLLRVPVAIVLHRRADSTGSLGGYVARRLGRDVIEPEDEEPILPGRIYLAPPDYHLLVEQATLRLDVSEPVFFARPAIDVLFESAADSYRDRTIAVLLSGASVDGAAGIRRVSLFGGHALIQDPGTAESPVAPKAGISAAPTAQVLSPEKIGRVLAKMCR